MEDEKYRVWHSNVDGAGLVCEYDTLQEAKTEADRQQSLADQDGNHWHYLHSVDHYGRTVYRTTSKPNHDNCEDWCLDRLKREYAVKAR
jgi:hypothetical protein